MEHDELLTLFCEETADLLTDYEAGLLRLEAHPDDVESLNHVFRCAHSLKGGASMMKFTDLVRVAHALESLLEHMRAGRRPVTAEVVGVLLTSTDALRALLKHVKPDAGNLPPEESESIERLLAAISPLLDSHGAAPPAASRESGDGGPAGSTVYEIDFRPPRDLFRRGLDPLGIIRALGDLGEVRRAALDLSALPSLHEMDPEECYLGWKLQVVTGRPRAELADRLEFAVAPGAETITAHPTPSGTPDAQAGPAVSVPSRGLSRRASDHEEAADLRVRVDKVDRLVNLVGELVTTQSMLAQSVATLTPERLTTLQETVRRMERHVREVHEGVMAVRMVSARALFGRFPRLVRDLAHATGKPAILELAGEDTELDKRVIERMADPLAHLVRNAVDHGLESADRRREAGKPAAGRIRLEAYQQGGNVYVEVADDGAGLDRDRIVAKAEEQGLVAGGQALADEEAFALILRPGFSTAEAVTEISGRGVGMDVVRKSVEGLGGSISIRSERGKGTRFRIQLPLTLAMVDGQVLTVGEQAYVLPLVAIRECVRPAPGSVRALPGGGEVVVIRGIALDMLRLHELFGVTPASPDPTRGLAVVVEHDGRSTALAIDGLGVQQQVVIKSVGAQLGKLEGIAGATILGDGLVALIIDVPGLIALAATRRRPAAA
jgi:two-component system chemotaxis sensor kinase CheA